MAVEERQRLPAALLKIAQRAPGQLSKCERVWMTMPPQQQLAGDCELSCHQSWPQRHRQNSAHAGEMRLQEQQPRGDAWAWSPAREGERRAAYSWNLLDQTNGKLMIITNGDREDKAKEPTGEEEV